MSHLEAAKSVPLLVTRGKSAMFRVEPLPDEPSLRRLTNSAPVDDRDPERQAEIEAEAARIEAEGGGVVNPDNQGCGGERVDSAFLKGALQLLTLVAVPMLLLVVVLVLAWWTR